MGMQASVEHLEKHYADLSKKPFFPGLVKYMASGPVVAMVWEGLNVVKTGRVRLGVTSATARMLWSQPTTKLLSGSSLRNLYLGSQPRRIGFMNRSRICEGINHQLFNHQWLMY